MNLKDSATYLWLALIVLGIGSIYLIFLGYKVGKFFSDSIVGKLVKALVVVFIIEIYSVSIVCYALIKFSPKAVSVLLPVVLLWIVSLGFAIFAVRSAKTDMINILKK
jgi:hypothetical protein